MSRIPGCARPPAAVLLAVSSALVLGTAVFQASLVAQDGGIQGRVRDQDGAAVVSASVLVLRGDTVVRGTDTDRLGAFRIESLQPGPYTVAVRALGYGELARAITVGAGSVQDLDLRVEVQPIILEGISVDAVRSRNRVRFEEMPGVTEREVSVEEIKLVPTIIEADPLRAIEVLPGVVSTSDLSSSYNVRGGSADQNLILLDGTPLFSPFHLGGFFSVFNADMIRRAELRSGGFAAEHGGRVSSVLEIESNPGRGDFSVDAGISVLASRIAVGARVPKGIAHAVGLTESRWRASARRSYFDLFTSAPYALTDYQLMVENWTPGGDRIAFTAYTGGDNIDLGDFDANEALRVSWDWGNDAVGLRWTRPRRGGGSLDLLANWSRYGGVLDFIDFSGTKFVSRIAQAQVRLDYKARPMPSVGMDAGWSAERISFENELTFGGSDFGGFGSGTGSGIMFGPYAQLRWSQAGNWLVEAGARIDIWRPAEGDMVWVPSPRLAIKRFIGRDNAFKLSAGRYAQFLHSLRDETLPIGLDTWLVTGPGVPHVVSDQAQLGLEGYVGDDWYWSAEAYLRTFDGVVAVNFTEEPNDPLDDVSPGDGLSYGTDFLVRRESGVVTGWLAVSLLKAERTFPDWVSPLPDAPAVSFPPIFDRRVEVDFVARMELGGGYEGGVRWKYGSGLPFTRPLGSYAYYGPSHGPNDGRLTWGTTLDAEFAVHLGDRNGSRYPAYHRLDVSIRKDFRRDWGSFTPYVSVVNLYDHRNVLFYFYDLGDDPPTRGGVSMFPILPSAGLEVHF